MGKQSRDDISRQPAWSGLKEVTKDGAPKKNATKTPGDIERHAETQQNEIDKGAD